MEVNMPGNLIREPINTVILITATGTTSIDNEILHSNKCGDHQVVTQEKDFLESNNTKSNFVEDDDFDCEIETILNANQLIPPNPSTSAMAPGSVAISDSDTTMPPGSMAIGDSGISIPHKSVAISNSSTATTPGSVDISDYGTSIPPGSVAISDSDTTMLPVSMAICDSGTSIPHGSVAISNSGTLMPPWSGDISDSGYSMPPGSTAIGDFSTSMPHGSVAIRGFGTSIPHTEYLSERNQESITKEEIDALNEELKKDIEILYAALKREGLCDDIYRN